MKTLKQHLKIFQFLNQQDEGEDWYYIHDIMKAVNSWLQQKRTLPENDRCNLLLDELLEELENEKTV